MGGLSGIILLRLGRDDQLFLTRRTFDLSTDFITGAGATWEAGWGQDAKVASPSDDSNVSIPIIGVNGELLGEDIESAQSVVDDPDLLAPASSGLDAPDLLAPVGLEEAVEPVPPVAQAEHSEEALAQKRQEALPTKVSAPGPAKHKGSARPLAKTWKSKHARANAASSRHRHTFGQALPVSAKTTTTVAINESSTSIPVSTTIANITSGREQRYANGQRVQYTRHRWRAPADRGSSRWQARPRSRAANKFASPEVRFHWKNWSAAPSRGLVEVFKQCR